MSIFAENVVAGAQFIQKVLDNSPVKEDDTVDGCSTTMKILVRGVQQEGGFGVDRVSLGAHQLAVYFVGGQRCARSKLPSIVQILELNEGEMQTKCGGTLIKADLVLTAAHCVTTTKMWIRQATDNYPERDDPINNERTRVTKVWVHPKYNYTWFYQLKLDGDWNKLLHVRHDIAILQFKVTKNVVHWRNALATLPNKDLGEELCNFCNLVQVLGWGRVDEEVGSGTLRCVMIPVNPMEYCRKNYVLNYQQNETRDYLCTSTTGRMALQGDSGGPVVCRNTQVGVVSWGRYHKDLALYTRVDRHLDFVNKIIRKTETMRRLRSLKWDLYARRRQKEFLRDVYSFWDITKTYFAQHVQFFGNKTYYIIKYTPIL